MVQWTSGLQGCQVQPNLCIDVDAVTIDPPCIACDMGMGENMPKPTGWWLSRPSEIYESQLGLFQSPPTRVFYDLGNEPSN